MCGSGDDSKVIAEQNLALDRLGPLSFSSRKPPEYLHYRLIRCPDCDLVYANPAPPIEELEVAYRHAGYESGSEARWAAATYARILPEVLARVPSRCAALDVGAGDGAFLRHLVDAGFESVSGVEPSRAPIAAADPVVRPLITEGLFRGIDYEPSSFDLVTCFQTIEHLHDPGESCREMAELLRRGGALYLVCHNRQAWSARALGRRSPIFDIEHLQLFSPPSLRALLTACGLEEIRVVMVINTYPLGYWLRLLPIPRSIKEPLLRVLRFTRLGALPVPLPAGNMAAWGYRRG